MKFAIQPTGWSFSTEWIAWCKQHQVDYKLVDCYRSDIVAQLADCDVLLFHHHHTSARDILFAKELLYAVQQAGKVVFPDFNTGWHFDDKLGQKYLLEAIGAPLVPTHVFFEKKAALEWVARTSFPKVFKLRGGAGSTNVRLVGDAAAAGQLIRRAFGRGFEAYDRWGDLTENIRRYRLGKGTPRDVLKSLRRVFYSTRFARVHGGERGYVYFQDFIPKNTFDIRIVTVFGKAIGIKRPVRENDFRASGSGYILYDKSEIDERCVQIAFDTTRKLQAQCVAYDFVFDEKNNPLIVEINFGYAHKAYDACPGHWDETLAWHPGPFNSIHWIIENLARQVAATSPATPA
jgi:glutathione synthase/RimK-type ligase-like ATP-grasp enzyme